MGYLFAGYVCIWGLMFGYIFYQNTKLKKVQKEIDFIKENL